MFAPRSTQKNAGPRENLAPEKTAGTSLVNTIDSAPPVGGAFTASEFLQRQLGNSVVAALDGVLPPNNLSALASPMSEDLRSAQAGGNVDVKDTLGSAQQAERRGPGSGSTPALRDPLPSCVEEALISRGQPLEAATRTALESQFDHDFGRVRIHRDPVAARSAEALNALAYTVGQDIVLGPGRYAPDTAEGRRLLAHELTHVVQQDSQGAVPRRSLSLSSSEAAEREAGLAAEAVSHGQRARISERLSPGVVSRQAKAPPLADQLSHSPAAESITNEQILQVLKQATSFDDFKLTLLGPVTDEYLFDFLQRRGLVVPENRPEKEVPYAGPSIRPARMEEWIVGRIIYSPHPDGGFTSKYVTGTAAELDQLQYDENRRGAMQMAQGFTSALQGLPSFRGRGSGGTKAPARLEESSARRVVNSGVREGTTVETTEGTELGVKRVTGEGAHTVQDPRIRT